MKRVDTASLNGRRFLNVSTGGVGAEATAETPADAKEPLGAVAYAITGVRKFAGLRRAHARGLPEPPAPRAAAPLRDAPGGRVAGAPLDGRGRRRRGRVVRGARRDVPRATFIAGLDALETQLTTVNGVALQGSTKSAFAAMPAAERGAAIGAVEQIADRRTPATRAHWQLKGLIIHGYFTSERVQKELLKFEMMPGRFDGSAPMRAS